MKCLINTGRIERQQVCPASNSSGRVLESFRNATNHRYSRSKLMPMWEVEYTDQFGDWYENLSEED
jgi:hypothetical protein